MAEAEFENRIGGFDRQPFDRQLVDPRGVVGHRTGDHLSEKTPRMTRLARNEFGLRHHRSDRDLESNPQSQFSIGVATGER